MKAYRINALCRRKGEGGSADAIRTFTVQANNQKEALERFFITFDDTWILERTTRIEAI